MARKLLLFLTVLVVVGLAVTRLRGGDGGDGDDGEPLASAVPFVLPDETVPATTPDSTAPTETTAFGGVDSDLVSAGCPDPVVVQTDWLPEIDHSDLYGLAAPGGDIDKERQRYTSRLVDPRNGAETGVRIEIRSGGPAIGYEQVSAALHRDPQILLGTVSTDEAILNAASLPTVAVVAPRERSSHMVMWDPASYPDVSAIADLRAKQVKVRFYGGTTYIDYLTSPSVAILDPSQIDATYDGTTTAFVADGGRSAQQGFATSEPYFYEKELPGWGKPVAYQLIADTGYDPYAGALAVRPGDVTTKAGCLAKLVPMVQAAQVQLLTDPAPTQGLIHRIVEQTAGAWTYSTGQAEAATAVSFADRIISNGSDATLGNFDDDKIQSLLDIVRSLAASRAVTVKAGLTPPMIATNQFVDPSIGLPG